MKNVITYLKTLWRRGLGSQSSDVSLDCRLTVGSPSVKCGSTLMRLVAISAVLLTIGVGNVWGAESIIYTLTPYDTGSDGTSTAYTGATNASCEDEDNDVTITWNVTGNTHTIPWRIGGKASAKGTTDTFYRNIYSTSTVSASNITKVVLTHATTDLTGDHGCDSVELFVSTAANAGGTVVSKILRNFKASDTIIINRPSNADWSNRYFTIRYKIHVKGTSNKHLQFSSAAFYADVSSCEKIGVPTVTATPGDRQISLSWPNQAEASSYTVTCTGGTPGAVTGTTTKSCTITGLTNGTSYTWTVTPVGDGSTYCTDGNTAASASATPNVYYTVTWMNNGSSYTTTSVESGQKPTFPDNPSSCDGTSTTFVGWTPTPWSGKLDDVSAKTIYTSGSAMPNVSGPVTYHAVFAKATGSGTTTQAATLNTSAPIISGTGWATSTSKTYSGPYLRLDVDEQYVSFTSPKGAISRFQFTYKLNSSTSCTGHNKVAWWIGDVKFYVSTDGGSSWSELSAKSINDINTGTGLGSDVAKDYTDLAAGGYNAIKVQLSKTCGNLGIKGLSATYSNASYSEYLTSCCTPLGSINGSVSWSNAATAVVSWDNLDHVSSWTVKYKTHAAGDYSTWAGEQTVYTKSTTNDSRKVTITGLTPCTNYDFQIIANPASGYCDKDQTIEDSQTHNWTVTSTGVTHATASPAIPSTTCSGFSTTISPATGYALPADITVTNASKTWNSSTGALTISSVTGNVSITITPTCVLPVISGDPADASYYVGDSPDALSVSATLASGTLTYLWKVSTNGGSTWSDAAGTNNAATYSGASLSTASAGTLKFKCIVGNSQGGCTVESGVATITVAEPSSWKFKYSGDSWEEHTMIEDAGVASYSISLDADSRFEFCFAGGSVYKNSGTMITTTSGWTFNTSDNNCKIHTGPAGTYTFAINTSTKSVTVTYPTVSHPNEHYVYFKNTNVWGTVYGYLANSENDNKAAAWPGSVMAATTTICGETYHYAALNAMSGTYNTIIFNNGNSGYGNQTSDLSTTGSLGKYNANSDAAWHQFKYAIRFDKGTGSGDAMSSIENLCPESDQALTANTYTKEHHTFAGWIADVDVKVGESTIDAGEIIDDEVTIKDIQSDINLTAQWTPNTYTITKTLTNVANVGLPASFTYTGATTTALNSTFTVDATNFFLPSSIAVTMGGTPLTAGTDYTYNNSTGAFTFSAVITGDIVITAAATAKLKSIAITTQPTTRKYFAGESFSSAGAVVTATMGDGSTKTVSETWDLTTLTAGAGQTVTASYSEGGIDQTATTTIDVYSVTVNKVNEDGDAISADGVTATWTVGTKTIVAGVGSTKYAFKQWEVTGATAASTTSASTTLSSPTANVVVNAVFYKPRVVKWSVNGDDSYATGGPTTEVAYNGTISTVPTDPSGLVCAGTFVAWTDAAHNNGTTAKDNASYYGSALYTAAGDFPNITAATTTFYAVFAEVPDEYYWSMGTIDQLTTGSGYATYDGEHTVKGSDGNNYTYTSQDVMSNSGNQFRGSSYCGRIYNTTSLGRITRIVLDYSAYAGQMKVYESDSEISSSGTTALTPSISDNRYTYNCSGKGYFIVIQEGSNAAKANVTVYFGDAPSNYVTECDANIVKVTYDANGGATSCTNTTTDKTEDFTVCSSAPTRDYYTFAGWLCSADSKTYAANATIDADAIDADFTLTAQWTPVPYDITYELDGGTNSGSNPATYNVTTATITLQNPTRDHDRFDGWYDNGSFTGDAVTSIPLGSHGDITLYAKWAERHEIIFDADGATTTIYRADDENLEDAVAGQGSVPSDPDAPTACSSKTFVGWSESEIDEETDTRPGDLMKSAAGTVDEDKHYYAVWATVTPTDPPATYAGTGVFEEITSMEDFETGTYYVLYGYDGESTHGALKNAGSGTAGEEAGTNMTVSTSSITNPSTDIVWKLGGTTDAYTLYNQSASKYIEITTDDAKGFALNASATTSYKVTVEDGHGFFFKTNKTGCTRGISIYTSTSFRCYALANAKNLRLFKLPTNTVTAYCTSCCGTKVTLSENSPEHGTIVFGKTSVGTCGGDKEVSLTITPAAGYQLHSYEVATGSGKVAAKSVSPDIALDNNSSAEQNITLTFAEDANGAYDVTASFTKMAPTAWTWTYKSEAIPNPINLYVGQTATLNATYTPSGLLNSEQNYDVTKSANLTQTSKTYASPDIHYTFRADAAMDDGTVTLTNQINTSLTTTVHVHVDPLPRVHFEDLVHGKEFADVVATLSENALNPNKTTKTSVDWVTPNANTCEENHLHLVGWIRSDWPALVAYLNGTGDAPTTTAIVGAGNDGSGNAYFFAPNASINVLTFNGATFYAVWAEIK